MTGVRHSVQTLQEKYDAGDKQPLEDVVRAWKGIKELGPDDPRSFFVLGGFHGEPFDLRPAVDRLSETDRYAYWGGYCNHGNVLFPTWHRIYVRKLEEALQSIVPGVMMPFWDETDEASLQQGIPHVLTDEWFELDGEQIPNPLKSFVLPEEIRDDYWGDNPGESSVREVVVGLAHRALDKAKRLLDKEPDAKEERSPYFKPEGYETVRYPLSGLVGNPTDRAKTKAHNAKYPDHEKNVELLNGNIRAWLHGGQTTPSEPDPHGTGIYARYAGCLRAPSYTVFSNTTSMEAWNDSGEAHAFALEDPHNDIHLAVGGYDLPVLGGPGSTTGQVEGSNGDMGENNTAALDPIFFFHHCNVDRMFWLWQQQNPDKQVEIIKGYAGANSNDSQGPTPGIAPGTALTMDSPLAPFKKADGTYYTSADCVSVEDMGYTYGPGSLEEPIPEPAPIEGSTKTLVVSGMNRLHFKGSFLVAAAADITNPDGTTTTKDLGHHSVLSRWNVEGCANCQTHLDVVARFPLVMLTDDEVDRAEFRAHVSHRGDEFPDDVRLQLDVVG